MKRSAVIALSASFALTACSTESDKLDGAEMDADRSSRLGSTPSLTVPGSSSTQDASGTSSDASVAGDSGTRDGAALVDSAAPVDGAALVDSAALVDGAALIDSAALVDSAVLTTGNDGPPPRFDAGLLEPNPNTMPVPIYGAPPIDALK